MSRKPPRVNIRFHDHLNPRLWQADSLRIGVRLKLFKTAISFYRFLDVTGLVVKDVVFTGSNAAYNYTKLSDLDIHLIVNFSKTECPTLAKNFFTTKKTLWNQTYDITIYNHPVELYVQDVANPLIANGVYSVLHNKWLKHPTKVPPVSNDGAVRIKAKAYADEIDSLLDAEPNISDINRILADIKTLRGNGLMSGGEFSVENLAFKALRSAGYLQKLHDARVVIRDKQLSLSA